MEDSILITVIVAAYNIEKWIGRCIESIQNQTYKNLEIIVVDDGSTDSTGSIIDQYASSDRRIVPIHKQNQGLVEARETGIVLAHGQYSCFVDGDDTVASETYERLLKNALEHNADISHCGTACCYDNGIRVEKNTNQLYIFNRIDGLKNLLAQSLYGSSLCDKLYKTELLYDSCFDKTILNNEDLVRNFTLFQRANRSVYQDFAGYEYWHRENSLSNHGKSVIRGRDVLRAKQGILSRVDNELKPVASKLLLESCINIINGSCFDRDPESRDFLKDCRMIIKNHSNDISLLSRRYNLIAKLIIISPSLHRFIYSIYKWVKRSNHE